MLLKYYLLTYHILHHIDFKLTVLVYRGVVVNFDMGERFPRPRSQQRGSLRPRARRVAVLGASAGGGPLPLRGSGFF